MNTLTSAVHRYDDMLYDSRPVSLHEFLSDKYNAVHEELYNNALNKYIASLINKHFTDKLLYEYYQILSKIRETGVNEDEEIIFDDIYKNILSDTEISPRINELLNDLQLDRYLFFKLMYDATSQKLNIVKNKLLKFYEDENHNLQPIIAGLTEISDIKDFRLNYISSKLVESETSPNELENYLYTVYIDDNNEIIVDDAIYESLDNNYSLFLGEDENIVILYDDNKNIRIGYTDKGKWILIVNEDTEFQNPNNIENLKLLVDHYINYESYHVIKLYKEQICNLYKRFHKIIEIKNSEYWMPSSIRIISKIPPYKKFNINLEEYWIYSQSHFENNLKNIKILKNKIQDSEITELNYVKGIAKMQSRDNDLTYEVPFKYLSDSTDVSDELILSRSFEVRYH